ncbi:C4-dicarboxylate ABC transporter permease [Thermotoga sp. Ku-13t]|uniref:TRAP transporter permease n=1 Tax=Thermotoga sp. Ku-13t TaxID=1755813 RepID=UPI0013EB5133|nr:TRAP transporter fused permease subunit [Thermotoga sp. Ku-13t]KAF2957109.1 C4-dicarboxylate ABC transporter permease [Thermotoga sp. Ku-13t]
MRELRGWQRWTVGGWLVAATLFHLYTATVGILQPRLQRGAHLLFLLPASFLLFPATKKSPKDRFTLSDALLAILSTLPPIYLILNNTSLNMRFEFVDPVTNAQIVLGLINIVLILEAIRRAVAPAMSILILGVIGYLYVAPFLPGVFYNKPVRLSRLVEMFYLLTDSGIYGSITGISATIVALFVIFGAFFEQTKVGDYLLKIASKLAGASPGGPAKIGVLASALFGTISGTAASNVYATGSFTIPMGIKLGYRPEFSAAVEAVASTGGIFVPPIMGAAAFVMSEITNVPYLEICLRAILGAVFYYIALGLTVHLVAVKDNLRGLPPEEIPRWGEIIKNSYLLLPVAALVYFLVRGFSPFSAAYYATWVAFALSFFRKDTMMTPKRIAITFEKGARNMIAVALACAGAGIVVSVFTNTGLGLGIASAITSLSGGRLLPALVLLMGVCLILGMGLPTTPAYVIAASIAGVALTKMKVDILAAHLFVLYFAMLSEITPPVCIASYCAASIAKANPMRVGFEGWRLALTGYIVGYMFIYNRAILLKGTITEIITLCILMTGISYFLAVTNSGYLHKPLNGSGRFFTALVVVSLTISAVWAKLPRNLIAVITLVVLVLLFVRAKMIERKPAS